tara:strand:- start:51 stop:398 length:348 start_codon:yes stop_codon:yes gene_type:complete
MNKKVNIFNLRKLILDLLNSFKAHIKKTKDAKIPGNIPNCLIMKPDIKAPVLLYKFVGISPVTSPQAGSFGLKENKIKKSEIDKIKRTIARLLIKTLVRKDLSLTSPSTFTIKKT